MSHLRRFTQRLTRRHALAAIAGGVLLPAVAGGRTPAAAAAAAPADKALPLSAGAATAGDQLLKKSGDNQQRVPGSHFANLVVQAHGMYGPLPNASLRFTVEGDTGSAFQGGSTTLTLYTDANGYATPPQIIAGSSPGPCSVVVAFTDGHAKNEFHLTVVGGPPGSRLTVVSGDKQSVLGGSAFDPLVVAATDSGGIPLAKTHIVFTVASTDPTGSRFPGGKPTCRAITGANGRATASVLTAGDHLGVAQITAQIDGLPSASATFQETVRDPSPQEYNVLPVSGNHQYTPANSDFKLPLTALVTLNNVPASGVAVRFVVAGSGRATFSNGSPLCTGITGEDGIAVSLILHAYSNQGDILVVGTVDGSQSVANFTLHVDPGHP